MKKIFITLILIFSLVFLPEISLGAADPSYVAYSKTKAIADGIDQIILSVTPCYVDDAKGIKADVTAKVALNDVEVSPAASFKITSLGANSPQTTECGAYQIKFAITAATAAKASVRVYIVGDLLKQYTTNWQPLEFSISQAQPTPTPTPTPEITQTPTLAAKPKPSMAEVKKINSPSFTKIKVNEDEYGPEKFSKLTLKADSKLTFYGTAKNNTKILIFLFPEQRLGKADVNSKGEWKYTFSDKLDPGPHRVEAKNVDAKGNFSGWEKLDFNIEGDVEIQGSADNKKMPGYNRALGIIIIFFVVVVGAIIFIVYKKYWLPKKNKSKNLEINSNDPDID